MLQPAWRKSSFSSGGNNECVEVGAAAGAEGPVRLRESDHPETVLTAAPGTWAAFLRSVKAGEFDRYGG
ncbi:MAG TPA: DUF397 domain-containing protein [Streptomyces sp.]|nr:DUF397 domain-containing protein [Streptomyces sp.]